MIKSISAWAFQPDRPLSEVFELARRSGFDGVEVAIGEKGDLTAGSTEADCRQIVKDAAAAGVQIVSLASGGGWQYPITSPDPELATKGVELAKRSLRIARWLDVDAVLLVPGGVGADFIERFAGTSYDIAYDNLLENVQKIVPVAEEVRVNLGIENVWNKFLLSPLEFRDTLDRIGSDFVGCYFDVGNVIYDGYPEQWIRILGKRIKRVHFKDFKRSVGTIDGFCDLLDGDVDFAAVMKALRTTGYDRSVTAEFFNVEKQLPAIAAAIDKILAM